jgi:hypothetical protein
MYKKVTANPRHRLPSSGLSEVIGMVLDTMFKNTVNESRMVTPESNSPLKFLYTV